MFNIGNSALLNNAYKDFNLFYSDNVAYQKKVNEISTLFNLKGGIALRNDYLPTYIVGNLEDNNYKYVLFSINPGFSEDKNKIEEKWKSGTWENYLNFIKNFFILYYKAGFTSRYYNRLGKLIGALENTSLDSSYLSSFFQDHLINIDIIPYHSSGIGLPSSLSNKQMNYLQIQLYNGINLLKTQNIHFAIFNGKPMYSLLIEQGIISQFERFPINDKVSLYKFKIDNISCILFDRFISQPAFEINNLHLTETIPAIIQDRKSR